MTNIKNRWLLELGQQECAGWVEFMENECLETVRISTPKVIDYSLAHPYQEREVLEYTIEDFANALEQLTRKVAA